MHIVDLFRKFDTDGNGLVTREEFAQGLSKASLPLSSAEIDDLVGYVPRTVIRLPVQEATIYLKLNKGDLLLNIFSYMENKRTGEVDYHCFAEGLR